MALRPAPLPGSEEDLFLTYGLTTPKKPAAPTGKRTLRPMALPTATKRGDKRPLIDEANGLLANVYAGIPFADEANAGIMAMGDALQGRGVPLERQPGDTPNSLMPLARSIGGTYNNALARQRGSEDDFATRRPLAATTAKTAGTALSVFVPGGAGEQVAAAPGRIAGAVRGATVGAGQGYVYGVADRGTIQERAEAGNRSAVVSGALGGVLGGLTAPGAARAKPKRQIDPNVATLNREGVQMTPGQMRGGFAKAAEDVATSTPILGDAIQSARTRGMGTFSQAPVKRALREVGEELPPEMVGNEAVSFAQDVFRRGYDETVPTGGLTIDRALGDDLSSAVAPIIQTLRPESQAQLQNIIRSRVQSRVGEDGAMTGEVYKRVQSELGAEIGRFTGSTDPDARAIGDALKAVAASLRDGAARQNPEFAAKLAQLDRGYAELVRAETAAARTGAEGGVFSPAQYDASVRAGDGSVRRRGYAAGNALGQDLADAGRAVLPNKLPDSGTAKRGMVNFLLAGAAGGGGGAAGGPAGAMASLIAMAGGLSAASRLYTPKAIEAANKALSARVASQEQAAALAELRQIATTNPQAMEVYRVVSAQLAKASGAVGSNATQSQPNALAASQ